MMTSYLCTPPLTIRAEEQSDVLSGNVGPASSAHETDFGDGTHGTRAMNQRCLRSTHSKMPSLAVASDGTGAEAATGPKS